MVNLSSIRSVPKFLLTIKTIFKTVGVDENDVSELLVSEITSMMSERSEKERHITVLTSVVEQSAGGLSSKQSTTSIVLSVD